MSADTLLAAATACDKGFRDSLSRNSLADLGFLEGGDSGNPSERIERALRGLVLRENEI